MISVLFVCAGNICRSPALQACFEKRASEEEFYVDSCGISSSFLGADPDRRMQEVANKRGIILKHKAKVFQDSYIDQFDYIIVATHEICEYLNRTFPKSGKIFLATEFSSHYNGKDIPDPYYDKAKGFEVVFDYVEDCAAGLYNYIQKEK